MAGWPDISRTELRLLAAFLLIFTIFIHWGGANSWSRYDLTRSIVDDGSLDISNYSYNTMDKRAVLDSTRMPPEYLNKTEFKSADKEGKRRLLFKAQRKLFEDTSKDIYSDKPPVSSLLAIPGYIAGDILGGIAGKDREVWIENGIADVPAKLSLETTLEQFFIVFTVSSAFGAATLVLLLRYLQDYVDEKTALYSVIAIGVATPLAYYATTFFGVINAAFFLLASYLAVDRFLDTKRTKWVYLAGLLSGLAVSTEYYAGIVLAMIGFYLFLRRAGLKNISRFGVGVFLGLIPVFLYHWLITGNPFVPLIFTVGSFGPGPIGEVCSVYQACFGESSFVSFLGVLSPFRVFNNFFRLLFFESRGLFFYSPVLLLSIPGVYELYKRDRKLLFLFPGAFLALLLFQSFMMNWLAGTSFGPRYAITALPFLALPFALGLKKILSKGIVYKSFVFLIFLFSSFNMLLGFNSLPVPDGEDYSENYNDFKPVQPDYYNELVSQFRQNGARSEVLMSSSLGPQSVELMGTGSSQLLFSTGLLPLVLVISVLALLSWEKLGYSKYAVFVLVLVILLSSLSFKQAYVLEESYSGQENERLASNGSLTAVYYLEEGEVPRLEVRPVSPDGRVSINVSVNGKETIEYGLNNSREIYVPQNLHKGRNEIELETSGCWRPFNHLESFDYRCLSFGVSNLSLVKEDSERILLEGWHSLGPGSQENVWMRKEGTFAFRSEGEKDLVRMTLTPARSLESNLTVTLNQGDEMTVSAPFSSPIYLPVEKGQKWNTLSLEADRCIVPAKQQKDSVDDRCLSFRLSNFSLVDSKSIGAPVLTQGWSHLGPRRQNTWMKGEGRIASYGNKTLVLDMEPHPDLENNSLDVYVNGAKRRSVSSSNLENLLYLSGAELGEGKNVIRLQADKCVSTGRGECRSFRLQDVLLLPQDRAESPVFSEGWYDEESNEGRSWRWMSSSGEIYFRSDGSSTLNMAGVLHQSIKSGKADIILNGESVIKDISLQKKLTSHLETRRGWNNLKILPHAGCVTPSKIGDSSDDRCLSFRLDRLYIQEAEYGDGWYSWEGNEGERYRWMENLSRISFFSNSSHVKVSFKLGAYRKLNDARLAVEYNGQDKSFDSESKQLRGDILLETEEGVNTLKFKSLGGCMVPSRVEEGSEDNRCLSYRLEELHVTEVEPGDSNAVMTN